MTGREEDEHNEWQAEQSAALAEKRVAPVDYEIGSCGDCRFFNKYLNNEAGVCRRYPPVARQPSSSGTQWSKPIFPQVGPLSGCGEWRKMLSPESELNCNT